MICSRCKHEAEFQYRSENVVFVLCPKHGMKQMWATPLEVDLLPNVVNALHQMMDDVDD